MKHGEVIAKSKVTERRSAGCGVDEVGGAYSGALGTRNQWVLLVPPTPGVVRFQGIFVVSYYYII